MISILFCSIPFRSITTLGGAPYQASIKRCSSPLPRTVDSLSCLLSPGLELGLCPGALHC